MASKVPKRKNLVVNVHSPKKKESRNFFPRRSTFSSQGLNKTEVQSLEFFKSIKEHEDLSKLFSVQGDPSPDQIMEYSFKGSTSPCKVEDSMVERRDSGACFTSNNSKPPSKKHSQFLTLNNEGLERTSSAIDDEDIRISTPEENEEDEFRDLSIRIPMSNRSRH